MHLTQVLMFAAVSSLYVGFSAVQGYLLFSMRGPNYRSVGWPLVLIYALLIWLPTSAFIVTLSWLPASLRVLCVIAGTTTILLVTFRPEWAPQLLWTRSFNRLYLGITMVLVALGSLLPWLPEPNAGALTVGLAACAAGLSAIKDTATQI